MKLFVRRVQIIVGQAEAHHHAGNFEHVLEVCDDGDRSAGADENRIFFENIPQCFGRGFDKTIVSAHHAGRPFAEDLDIGFSSLGRELLHELGYFFRTSSGSWFGHQPH